MRRLAFFVALTLVALPMLARGFGPQELIPTVVNAPGKFGTFYKTDFFIINDSDKDQDVLIDFLPAGGTGGPITFRFVIKAHTSLSITDFLGVGDNRINLSGVGSLLVTAVKTGTTTFDDTGLIHCAARIWTEQPGIPGGTTSFAFEGLPPTTVGARSALIDGVKQDADNRTNVAVTNLGTSPHTYTIDVLGAGSPAHLTVTVPPASMTYVPLPDVTPSNTGYVTLRVTPDGTNHTWDCAAVTANNPTGDASAFWGSQQK